MLKNKFWIIVILCIASVLLSEASFAQRGRGRGNRGGGFQGRHSRYYYRGGSWYRHGWLGGDIAFSALAIGALIDSLPPRYTTVVYGGVPYYYYDGYYYRPYYGGGYVVVQPPVVAQPVVAPPIVAAPEATPVAAVAPAPASAPAAAAPVEQPKAQTPETLIVNIPNSKGGYTKITLKKSGDGYVGQQGEYYPGNPTVEQLKVLYDKQ